MSAFSISLQAEVPRGARCLVPSGLSTPTSRFLSLQTRGTQGQSVAETKTGQQAVLVEPDDGLLDLTWHFDGAVGDNYPAIMFDPRPSRFTRFADDLIEEVEEIAPGAPGTERIRAIACATAERFSYGHPDHRFMEGQDHVPALGCSLTEGSCVDINTYFIASLRAAGFEAGYVTGFFFPQDKGDWCEDGHCWVVSRVDGLVQEWDIAHHLKMGTRDIYPALNPKPGFRAACFHSMGLDFPSIGVMDAKVLIEPCIVTDGGMSWFETAQYRLHHPEIGAGTLQPASRVGV